MTTIISGSTGITLPNSQIVDAFAYANFGALFDDSYNFTIADTTTYGKQMPIYRTFSTPKNITVNVSPTGGSWEHGFTGYYVLHMMYRQASGGDLWTHYAITKDGAQNVVGITARMGSEDAHTESFHIIYKVDSTTSTYQMQGWVNATGRNAGVTSAPSGNPGWVGLDTQISLGTWVGRTVDIFVYRISGL